METFAITDFWIQFTCINSVNCEATEKTSEGEYKKIFIKRLHELC